LSFQEQIQDQIKQSLKDGDRLKLSTLRMLMAAIQQKEIDTKTNLSSAECLTIVEKQVQLRLEAAEQYQQGERKELFDKEMAEAEILRAYLPEKLDAEAVKEIISEIIKETGAESLKDMGIVMGKLKQEADGKIDMKLASDIVKESLSK
tara:strand:- start:689 stop:1135 length:447 start_codon:yes stop_codon:yes gene_type:complete